MRRPLDDVTVVALEQAVAAPYATRQLADLGARVIKIERPGAGDFARGYDRTTRGQSSYFVWLNRGKESVELDVKDPADRALLGAMIDRADVFVQNLIPGAARRLGLDAESLRSTRPGLIHCSISGYGEGGPYATKKAYDLLVQCEAGLVMSTGTPETPSKAGFSVADLSTGMFAFSGILTALYDRERTGTGATLRVSLLDALGELMTQPAYFSRYGGEPPRRTGARHPSISPYGPFKVSDGSVFFGIQNEREWLTLCHDVLHRGDLAADPRFASNPDRVTNHDELTAIIEESFQTLSADQVSDALEAAGIASARLRAPADLTSHPQLRARNRWRTVGTPGGDIEALLPPVEVAGADPVMGPVPALGEHTAAVRAEFGKDIRAWPTLSNVQRSCGPSRRRRSAGCSACRSPTLTAAPDCRRCGTGSTCSTGPRRPTSAPTGIRSAGCCPLPRPRGCAGCGPAAGSARRARCAAGGRRSGGRPCCRSRRSRAGRVI